MADDGTSGSVMLMMATQNGLGFANDHSCQESNCKNSVFAVIDAMLSACPTYKSFNVPAFMCLGKLFSATEPRSEVNKWSSPELEAGSEPTKRSKQALVCLYVFQLNFCCDSIYCKMSIRLF